MSGGSYNYAFLYIDEMRASMENADRGREVKRNLRHDRAKFIKIMRQVSVGCKAIEWEDSGDSLEEHTAEHLSKVFAEIRKVLELSKEKDHRELIQLPGCL